MNESEFFGGDYMARVRAGDRARRKQMALMAVAALAIAFTGALVGFVIACL